MIAGWLITKGIVLPMFGIAIFPSVWVIVPVVLSMLAGVTNNYFIGLRGGLTLKWVEQVWEMYADTFWLSLLIALFCLLVTLAIGVPAAWGLLKAPGRWAARIEECLMLPVALPGLATALGIILLYGQFSALRDSWVFILIGHVLFTLPFMMRPVLAVMQAVDMPRLEEASASLGASLWQRHFGRRVYGYHLVCRRVQHHLDAAYATNQNPAGRPCRQLRLNATGSGFCLHADFHFDDSAAAADAECGESLA